MRFGACLVLALAFVGAAAADAETPAPPIYKVIKEDVSIPFADRRVSDFQRGLDGSLLLRAGVSEWYRVEVWQPCKADLRWENAIGLRANPAGNFDRFSRVFVDGNQCAIDRVDRIEDPRPAEKALRERAKAESAKS